MTAAKTKSIMIVEDETLIALNIKAKLISWGYNISGIASNSEKALNIVKDERPDIILMDINIADEIDGIELAGRLLQQFEFRIIFMTGFENKEYMDRANKLAPEEYLIKPVNWNNLQKIISNSA